MKFRFIFSFCAVFFFTTQSWGQTWNLTPTMTANLDSAGVLTISTTQAAEAMPDYILYGTPWSAVRDSIRSAVIEDKVSTIGATAFYSCSNLTSVTIPNSVTTIEESAFQECFGLTSVIIPNSVTTIGKSAFQGCYGLTSVTISNSVETIENTAFVGCSGLTSITIPNSVTTIKTGAFNGCSGLTSVIIPNSVKTIENGVFCGTSLKDVTVEWSMPLSVPASLFCNVNTFATLHVPAGSKALYQSADVWKDFGMIVEDVMLPCEIQSWNLTSTMTAVLDCAGVLTISTTQAGGEAMPDYSNLASVTWYSVQNLISDVIIGENVTTIGNYAFANCGNLTSVTIPNSVTFLGDFAFANCDNLPSLTIPSSVTRIGYGSLMLKTLAFIVDPDNATFSSLNGVLFDKNQTMLLVYPKGKTGNYDIPETVTSTDDWAFYNCTGLTSISIPNSLTTFGLATFQGCTGLTSVTIPESVTTIGQQVFAYCSNLMSVTIPESVTSIGYAAFYNSGLTSVTIPNRATLIGEGAFQACNDLTDVTVSWEMPLSVPIDIFQDINLSAATLHVPAGTKALYQAADVWKDFGTIVEKSVVVEETEPVAQNGTGVIELSLSIPSAATLTGSFKIQLPEGMVLNEDLTKLVPELAANFSLRFTFKGNNAWLIEIIDNGLRSSTAVEYRKIMDIAYKVEGSVSKGEYEALITNLDFTLNDDSSIKEPKLPVPITVLNDVTSIGSVNASFNVYTVNKMLIIESARKELISIYSVAGNLLYSTMKESGRIEIPVNSLRGSVFIVKGSVSGSVKVIKN